MSVSSGLELLTMNTLLKIPYWSQALPWLPTWTAVHLLADYCWGNKLYIQMCDYTLSWAKLALVSTSLLGRLSHPCQVNCSWFCLRFVVCKAAGSALLWSSVLIWRAVSAFLLSLAGTWFSFQLFRSRSGHLLHSRGLFSLVHSLNWWMHCWWIVCCPHNNVWLSLLVFDCMP